MPTSDSPPRHPALQRLLGVFGSLCGICLGPAAWSQAPTPLPAQADAAPARPAAASAPARPPTPPAARPGADGRAPATPAQRVEITGHAAPDNQEERRRAIASRIVIGREEIERMGDNSLAEVLKRLPGVTLGGPPGRGGGPRMRGMGGGYTLILIDGQRMPPGFSLDNVPPEQIERIEVMRAPVAEFTARGIAGMINVVMRSDFKRKANEARFGFGADGRRPQMGGNWQRNGQTEALGYNVSISAFRSGQDNDSTTHIQGGEDDNGRALVDQESTSRSRNTRNALFGTGRLQLRLGTGRNLDLQPFANLFRTKTQGQSTRQAETPAATDALAFTAARWDSRSESKTLRLNGTWVSSTASGGRLQARMSTMLAQSDSHTDRLETGGTAGGGRLRVEDAHSRDHSVDLSGKFSQLLAERHSIGAGWELQLNKREDFLRTTIDGKPLTAGLGEEIDATIQRVALYAQDEWEWDKSLSFYLGARWEGIRTQAEGAVATATANRSSVLTPLAHLVWKLPDRPRDQIRMSLTRSYRSPNTNQLIARPVVNSLYADLTRSNTPTAPDRSGNPALLPELAWSLELGYERYLDAGGILTANAYYKRIDNLIRNVTPDRPEVVSYASAPRYVSRPINLGQADTAGLELEARMRAADLWKTDLNLALRSNLSLMWSQVEGVQGPNNRIAEQPPWTLNLGADWTVRGTPLTVGGSWSYTPGFEVQQIDAQATRQGKKSALDAYALWRLNPEASLRLTLNNLLAQDYDSGSTRYNANSTIYQVSDSRARTYTTVNLRAEIKF